MNTLFKTSALSAAPFTACRLLLRTTTLWTPFQSRSFAELPPDTVGIGSIQRIIREGNDPSRIPNGYLSPQLSQELLQHLRWMMQKDSLNQDMFLIGPPSPYRRWLAMQFAELTQQEVEFVQLTRDTTESDLKQRREINSGDVLFVDQAPVRAAKEGRCLILDGVEKIERNVLPTINNLLENREMHLDDGSFMLSSDRYDELVQNGENVNGLLRVHPDFRVIALGLPVPPFPGSTLDPPLRSRFQARVIMPPSSNILLEELLINVPNLPIPMAKKIVTFVEGIRLVSEESDRSIPPFPTHSLITIGKILERCSMETDVIRIISRSYPYINPSMEEGAFDTSMVSILKKVVSTYLDGNTKGHTSHYTFPMENENNITDNDQLNFNIGNNVTLNCYGGTLKKNGNSINPINDADIVPLNCYSHILLDMLQDHSTNNDLLIVGPKGCGKSILCKFFASKLNYSPILFQMYKDMTARDLLQRRATDESGNTYWEPSPVVNAAINGDLVILDGLDRLSMDTLTALQRLIVDREVELFDGTRLVSSEVTTTEKNNSSSKVYQVHPSFRIVAIGCPPSISNPWMTEEVATWFRTSVLSSPSKRDTLQMIFQLYPETPKETVNKILEFSLILSNMTSKGHKDEDKRAIGMSKGLSLRQILRLARHMNSFPDTAETSLASRIDDMLMVPYLPPSKKDVVRDIMRSVNIIMPDESNEITSSLMIETRDRTLKIGDVSMLINNPERPEMVPNPLFFEIPSHTRILQNMMRDLISGEKHLLLLGPQGCGKNKLSDKLCNLLKYEREYVQLHRDSTVGTLTLSPSLLDGKLIWEDSPLVRAVKNGYVLMVDEADKAPVEVTSILKSLVEDEEMLLADGRRIVSSKHPLSNDKNSIVLHENFKMIVLANRPGFPFLGNNFFRDVGDIFPTHTIDNPDENSERKLLKKYGPNVKDEIIHKLASVFRDLRLETNTGKIQYPYSTREAVAIVKHLDKYSQDGVSSALEDVLSFDAFDSTLREQLMAIFKRHGIPLKSNPFNNNAYEFNDETLTVNIAQKKKIQGAKKMGSWKVE